MEGKKRDIQKKREAKEVHTEFVVKKVCGEKINEMNSQRVV
jgi:hypothetical protein